MVCVPVFYDENVAAESAVLATVGVILTSGITGLIAYLLLDISLIQALLLGCIVGSTDAAAVFSLLGKDKNISLKSNVSNTLQIESATNDPMAILLTTTMIAFASQKPLHLLMLLSSLCSSLVLVLSWASSLALSLVLLSQPYP